jgi:hypothetical protein
MWKRNDAFSMSTAIEVGWLIAALFALYRAVKYVGAARTLWWGFAATSLVCLLITLLSFLRLIHPHDASLSVHSLLIPGVLSVLTMIYGVAWWTFWKRKSSATAWAIAASLTNILLPLLTIWSSVHFSRSVRGCSGFMLAIGVSGFITFLRRDEHQDPGKNQTNS